MRFYLSDRVKEWIIISIMALLLVYNVVLYFISGGNEVCAVVAIFIAVQLGWVLGLKFAVEKGWW